MECLYNVNMKENLSRSEILRKEGEIDFPLDVHRTDA